MEKEPQINFITTAAEKANIQKLLNIGQYCPAKSARQTIRALSKIKKNKTIIIYDITHIEKSAPPKRTLHVKDHINQTGENWLRGNQKKLKISFIDITKLYNRKTGVVTVGLGANYKNNKSRHKHPSTDLCNIAIIARAMGFYNITGRLINMNI